MILPYVEGDNLFKSMNFNVPAYAQNVPEDTGWGSPGSDRAPAGGANNLVPNFVGVPAGMAGQPNPNKVAALAMPKLFLCPSAVRGRLGFTNTMKDYAMFYDAGVGLAQNNERCCPERNTGGGNFSGMGWVNSQVKMAEVTDGTSNTMHFTEKANWTNQSWCFDGSGCNQFIWVHHQSQGLATANQAPNWVPHNNNSRSARGSHTQGVMVSFVDGHVQFIPNSINFATWKAMGSRSGGEVVSPP